HSMFFVVMTTRLHRRNREDGHGIVPEFTISTKTSFLRPVKTPETAKKRNSATLATDARRRGNKVFF
ncbi:MAG: hypothetical protein ACPGPS_20590, partial [Rubripirellula sp.]